MPWHGHHIILSSWTSYGGNLAVVLQVVRQPAESYVSKQTVSMIDGFAKQIVKWEFSPLLTASQQFHIKHGDRLEVGSAFTLKIISFLEE